MTADVQTSWLWGTPPSAALGALVRTLEAGAEPTASTTIKAGRSRTVYAVPDVGVLVKRFAPARGLVARLRPGLAQREYRIMEGLCRAGLPTTRPIGVGERRVDGQPTDTWFIARLEPDARTLADVIETVDDEALDGWIERAVDVVARLHDHPFHHRDLHAGNLLVDEHDALLIIDLHSVWRVAGSLSDARRAATLAELLYSLRSRMSLDDVPRWAAHYAHMRGERVDATVARVVAATRAFARDHVRGRAARCLRNSSEFMHGKLPAALGRTGYVWRRREVSDDELAAAWQEFEDIAMTRPAELLGDARRSQVARVHAGEWVGKSFREKGLGARWRARLRAGRGRSAWRAGRRLEVVDIPTPATLALVEWSDGSAFLLVEHVPGQTLREVLEGPPVSPRRRRQLAAAAGWLVGRLWRAGLHHPDMSTKNLLVAATGEMPVGRDRSTRAVPGTPLVHLIDLDNLATTRPHDADALARMLGQLSDVPDTVTRTDRRRFERALEDVAGRAVPGAVAEAAAARAQARRARRESHARSTSTPPLA